MKKLSVVFLLQLLLLATSIFAQDFKPVRDGVEYAEMSREIDKIPVKMNLLRLDLSKVRLDVVHALDSAIGLEKTSSIARRHGAIAAVNAGFFRIDRSIYEGDNVAALAIDGKILSENSNNRIALFINNGKTSTAVKIGRFNPTMKIYTGKFLRQISGVNRERKENELILFTPEFHRTTLTDADGLEMIVANGKITQIRDGRGSSEIPANGFVLSATGKMRDELKALKIGTRISIETSLPDNEKIEDVVTGVPQLVRDGKVEVTWQAEKSSKAFVETKHPRTAVAKLKDGKFLMITLDGRSEASGGIALQNLAELLLEMGAVEAMNLDGGGSTTMFLDGKIVNKPSDKEGERKIGDAILVFPRN